MAEDKNKKTPEVKDDETEKKDGITLPIPTTKEGWKKFGRAMWDGTKKFAGFVTKLGGFVGGCLTLYGAASGIYDLATGSKEEPAKDVIDTDGDFKEDAAVGSDEDVDA